MKYLHIQIQIRQFKIVWNTHYHLIKFVPCTYVSVNIPINHSMYSPSQICKGIRIHLCISLSRRCSRTAETYPHQSSKSCLSISIQGGQSQSDVLCIRIKLDNLNYFIFKKWANPGLFLFFFVLFNNNFTEKIVDFSGNRTWIVGVEGEHADHQTTTTALK